MFTALRRAFVDARALQDLRKHLPDLILDDVFRVFGVEFRMSSHEFLRPIRVLGKRFGCPEIFAIQERLSEVGHLLFQSPGQDGKPHDLDQADVFLLDVVQLLMRMIPDYFKRGTPQDDALTRLAVSFFEN